MNVAPIPPTLAMIFGSDGPMEWIVIGLAVLLLFGSQRLPDTMRTLGRWSAKIYRARDDFRKEFQKALEEPRFEIGDQKSEIEPPTSALPPPPEEPADGGPVKPLLGHLDDLRRMILRSAAVIAVLFCVALTFAPLLFTFLKWPLRRAAIDPDRFLSAFTVTGGITLWMQMAFWAALVAGAPLLLAIWTAYLLPALKPRERQMLVRGLLLGALLFLAGATLAFAVMLPPTLRVMLDIYGWLGIPVTFWAVDDYVGFCLKLMLAFGITFEMPVVLLALGYLGIVSSGQLAHYWRHAVVIALIVAMVVTPTTDPVSQLVLAAPLVLLYALSILLLWSHERRQSASS